VTKKLLVLEPDNFPSVAVDALEHAGFDVIFWSKDALPSTYSAVSVLFIRLAHYIDSGFVSQFPQLDTIITPTTGVTHISEDVREKTRIIKIDPDDYFIGEITPTAEHAVLLALMAQRNIKEVFDNIDDKFSRPASTFGTLKHAKVLIFGYGRIGSHVARLIQPFTQSEADSYDIVPERSSISYESLQQKMSEYDLVFICTKYNGAIQIDNEFIRALGNKAILVNIARGEIVDERAILDKLKGQSDFVYCTDVLTDEHLYGDNILYREQQGLNNLILTPHIGGFCYKSLQYIEHEITKKFIQKITR
jgi:D-3-phosphoglycerate dehydrogenase